MFNPGFQWCGDDVSHSPALACQQQNCRVVLFDSEHFRAALEEIGLESAEELLEIGQEGVGISYERAVLPAVGANVRRETMIKFGS